MFYYFQSRICVDQCRKGDKHVAKNYKLKIAEGLRELRKHEERYGGGSRMFDQESDSDSVGQIFQIVSDTTDGLSDDHPTRKLFREANLSYFDPYDWDYLLSMLASVHYGKKQGRPKEQREAFKDRLVSHVNSIVADRNRRPTAHAFGKLFLERYGSEYKKLSKPQSVTSMLKRHGVVLDQLFNAKQADRSGRAPVSSRTRTEEAHGKRLKRVRPYLSK
jgi:hypothetical protein